MADVKFIAIPEAMEIDPAAYFVGVQDNGGGSSTDYRYTQEQIANKVAELTKKFIEVTADSDSVTDDFFSNTISEIVTNGQAYLLDVNFTQTGTTITGIGGLTFYSSQVILAKI